MSLKTTKCKSCQADIFWARSSKKGEWPVKTMPVDAEPTEFGNLLMLTEEGKPVVSVISGAKLVRFRAQKITLYASHFSTCTDANAWRQR